MDGYLADPAILSDEALAAWMRNFNDQPPTMDYIVEWGWAGRIAKEFAARNLNLDGTKKEVAS